MIAWVPYVLGLVIRTLIGAKLLPTNFLTQNSLETGGALEITLLSFALADRIRDMREELLEKEQKVVLEQKVEDKTKKLKQANATKDKFFSIIAHDLRSPMIGLQGLGQKLEYFIKKDKQEKLLEMGGRIDQSINQLNHLLNWAAPETGSISKNPQKIDLKQLVEENIAETKSLQEEFARTQALMDEAASKLQEQLEVRSSRLA